MGRFSGLDSFILELDPDPAFYSNAGPDPDPPFPFIEDPDLDLLLIKVMRICDLRSIDPIELHIEPLGLNCERTRTLRGSLLSF